MRSRDSVLNGGVFPSNLFTGSLDLYELVSKSLSSIMACFVRASLFPPPVVAILSFDLSFSFVTAMLLYKADDRFFSFAAFKPELSGVASSALDCELNDFLVYIFIFFSFIS